MEETQKMGFTNVWLKRDSALVLMRLLLVPMFLGCFIMDEIFILITVRKSGLGLFIFFREGNVCVDKLVNLGFIHREHFHWYNRLPSSLFLEFFMNIYE